MTDFAATPQPRRAYDHRLREQVLRTGTRALTRHLAIPRSTVSTWRRRGLRPVTTIEPIEQDRRVRPPVRPPGERPHWHAGGANSAG